VAILFAVDLYYSAQS